MPPRPDLYVFPDLEELHRRSAAATVRMILAAVQRRGTCAVALAGGNTPRRLYQRIGQEHGARIPWTQVHLFWGDERYVPHDDPRSNYRMARETLIDHVPIPSGNVHPMPTDLADADEAASSYQALLEQHFPHRPPLFDLMLLGLSADGHIASLFPGSPALEVTDRLVVAAHVPADPSLRLTLTFPAINSAEVIYFVVAGSAKAEALQRTLAEAGDVDSAPARGVVPRNGRVVWWVDAAAAARLDPAMRATPRL